ncbi:hypothetical protein V8G54_007242 [Vigna mungo]|uniref:Uncharacterized protein n=1 Tax=Vigna mungo TaxID=3915 RepID=A0AAQ3P1D9_VIGMU
MNYKYNNIRHSELAATLIPQLGNGPNSFLKSLSAESKAVTDPTKLSQTENHWPRLRQQLHQNTTQHQKATDRVSLSNEKRGQRRHPQEREEGLEEPPEYPRRSPCALAPPPQEKRTATAPFAPATSPTRLLLDNAKEKTLFVMKKARGEGRSVYSSWRSNGDEGVSSDAGGCVASSNRGARGSFNRSRSTSSEPHQNLTE